MITPRQAPAEAATLSAALIGSANEFFSQHYLVGSKIMVVGLIPVAMTALVRKFGWLAGGIPAPPTKG